MGSRTTMISDDDGTAMSMMAIRSPLQDDLPPPSPDLRPIDSPLTPSSHSSSPPDSPSSASVSSLPSVSSSFFFSSAAASPGPHPAEGFPTDDALIIPSLALPAPLRRPTSRGKALGSLRVLVLAHVDAVIPPDVLFTDLFDTHAIQDLVDVGPWELTAQGGVRVLRASTYWLEHRDGYGLAAFEPARNVEVVDLGRFDDDTPAEPLAARLRSIIHAPFHTLAALLDPAASGQSPVLTSLIAGPSTPLHTALILLLPPTSSPLTTHLSTTLALSIPLIPLPTPHPDPDPSSSFRPSIPAAIRTGFFHSPDILAALRAEAASRFLRWHDTRIDYIPPTARAVHARRSTRTRTVRPRGMSESEHTALAAYDGTLRRRHLQSSSTSTSSAVSSSSLISAAGSALRPPPPPPPPLPPQRSRPSERAPTQAHAHALALDPLNLPSLLSFSLLLLGPLRTRVTQGFAAGLGRAFTCTLAGSKPHPPPPRLEGVRLGLEGDPCGREGKKKKPHDRDPWHVGVAFIGGLCVGVVLGGMAVVHLGGRVWSVWGT